jgi:hypothetical protein
MPKFETPTVERQVAFITYEDQALARRIRRMYVKGWNAREIADYLTLLVGTVKTVLRDGGFVGVR